SNELNASSSEDNPIATVVFPGVLPGVNYTVKATPVSLQNVGFKGLNPVTTTIFPTESSSGAVVGGVLGALFIIALIMLIFLFIRKRKQSQKTLLGEANSTGN
ncbi:unnamed protein product, partial [Meganyctiphanes norvegica]